MCAHIFVYMYNILTMSFTYSHLYFYKGNRSLTNKLYFMNVVLLFQSIFKILLKKKKICKILNVKANNMQNVRSFTCDVCCFYSSSTKFMFKWLIMILQAIFYAYVFMLMCVKKILCGMNILTPQYVLKHFKYVVIHAVCILYDGI